MKIGIIIHSKGGNTLYVANQVTEALTKAGHTVTLEKLVPDDEKQSDPGLIKLNSIPNLRSYDGFILACPVRGGSVSPALSAFLKTVDSFEQKKVAYFVTEYFPFKWMGGNSALQKMKMLVQNKGAVLVGCCAINWTNKKRKHQIEELSAQMVRWF